LDSICNQSYTEWKCFLINDGSTDDSAEICLSYESKDSRFTYVFQNNQGLSAARNSGIECAMKYSTGGGQGRYICFIDSDDYIERDYLKKLVEPYFQNNN